MARSPVQSRTSAHYYHHLLFNLINRIPHRLRWGSSLRYMKRNIVVNLVFLCVAGAIILVIVFVSKQPTVVESPVNSASTTQSTPAVTGTSSSPSTNTLESSFTSAQVAQHKTKDDCWTIVRGNVYNVTSWISKHPGGSEAIIYMCGIDASSAFVDQHDGKRKPEAELASFKIGVLK